MVEIRSGARATNQYKLDQIETWQHLFALTNRLRSPSVRCYQLREQPFATANVWQWREAARDWPEVAGLQARRRSSRAQGTFAACVPVNVM